MLNKKIYCLSIILIGLILNIKIRKCSEIANINDNGDNISNLLWNKTKENQLENIIKESEGVSVIIDELPKPILSKYRKKLLREKSRKLKIASILFKNSTLKTGKHKKSEFQNALQIAATQGMEAMAELYDVKEPNLIKKGYFLEKDHPGAKLNQFSAPLNGMEHISKGAYAAIATAHKLKNRFDLDFSEHGRQVSPKISLRRTPLEVLCPPRATPKCNPATNRYRTHDGTCNNARKPLWGSAQMPFNRFIAPDYSDGLESFRRSVTGGALASSRFISLLVHGSRDEDAPVTLMLAQWGQLIDHDLTSTAQPRTINGSVPRCCGVSELHPSCAPIKVPRDDPWLAPLGVLCLEFLRSAPAQRHDCRLSWREQTNQATSYLDASPIYSSNSITSDNSRVFRNGMLMYGRTTNREDVCSRGALSNQCIRPGDGRSGEQPGLVALHQLWVSEHNRIAFELSEMNLHWSDEKLYQEARRIVGGLFQHITFREFLPLILGKEVCRLFDLDLSPTGYYTGYDIRINAQIANSFSSAAFRFGHSLIKGSYMRADHNHQFIVNNVSLHEENFRGDIGGSGSLHRLLRGLINQHAQKRSEFITAELTNHLFQSGSFPFGLDLAAINIQRGRDHGLPAYTQWREPCGLSPINDWNDFEKIVGPNSRQRIERGYRHVDDVDLFVAGLAERPVIGGLVGPTFACIIAQQFSNLRKGDRFWYENDGFESSFTPAQLQSIRQTTLAQILCHAMDNIGTIQPHVFLPPDQMLNERIPCNTGPLGPIDLRPWAEHDPFQNINRIVNMLNDRPVPHINIAKKSQSSVLIPVVDDTEEQQNVVNKVDFLPNRQHHHQQQHKPSSLLEFEDDFIVNGTIVNNKLDFTTGHKTKVNNKLLTTNRKKTKKRRTTTVASPTSSVQQTIASTIRTTKIPKLIQSMTIKQNKRNTTRPNSVGKQQSTGTRKRHTNHRSKVKRDLDDKMNYDGLVAGRDTFLVDVKHDHLKLKNVNNNLELQYDNNLNGHNNSKLLIRASDKSSYKIEINLTPNDELRTTPKPSIFSSTLPTVTSTASIVHTRQEHTINKKSPVFINNELKYVSNRPTFDNFTRRQAYTGVNNKLTKRPGQYNEYKKRPNYDYAYPTRKRPYNNDDVTIEYGLNEFTTTSSFQQNDYPTRRPIITNYNSFEDDYDTSIDDSIEVSVRPTYTKRPPIYFPPGNTKPNYDVQQSTYFNKISSSNYQQSPPIYTSQMTKPNYLDEIDDTRLQQASTPFSFDVNVQTNSRPTSYYLNDNLNWKNGLTTKRPLDLYTFYSIGTSTKRPTNTLPGYLRNTQTTQYNLIKPLIQKISNNLTNTYTNNLSILSSVPMIQSQLFDISNNYARHKIIMEPNEPILATHDDDNLTISSTGDEQFINTFDQDGYLRPEYMHYDPLNAKQRGYDETPTIPLQEDSFDDYVLPKLTISFADDNKDPQVDTLQNVIQRNSGNNQILAEDVDVDSKLTASDKNDKTDKTKVTNKVNDEKPSFISIVPFVVVTKPERPDRWIMFETQIKSTLPELPPLKSDGFVSKELPKPMSSRIFFFRKGSKETY